MKKNPITVTISLSRELFDELEQLRNAIPRSSYYRILMERGKDLGNSGSNNSKQIKKQNLIPKGTENQKGINHSHTQEDRT